MNYFTVILYSTSGDEIARYDDIEGMRAARERAADCLSEEFALTSETTHAALRTDKVAIFKSGADTGHNAICEWDKFLPDHLRASDAEAIPFLPLEEAAKRWPNREARWSKFRRGGTQWTSDTLFRVVRADIQQLPSRIVGRERECEQAIAKCSAFLRSLDREILTPQASGCIRDMDKLHEQYLRMYSTAVKGGVESQEAWEGRRLLDRVLDEVDTACAVVGLCDLSEADRTRFHGEWLPIQQLKSDLQPLGVYAQACRDAGNVAPLPAATAAARQPATR